MIAQETVKINGVEFIYTHSTDNFLIKQIESGELYGEAYDLTDKVKHYEETDELIEND